MGSRNQRNGNRHSNNKSKNKDVVNVDSIRQEADDETIVMVGRVLSVLPNVTFNVTLENGKVIFCHIAGKMRKNRIKIILNDKVVVKISKYDTSKGRIVLRTK